MKVLFQSESALLNYIGDVNNYLFHVSF